MEHARAAQDTPAITARPTNAAAGTQVMLHQVMLRTATATTAAAATTTPAKATPGMRTPAATATAASVAAAASTAAAPIAAAAAALRGAMIIVLAGMHNVTALVEDWSSWMAASWYHSIMPGRLLRTKLSGTVMTFYEWDTGLIKKHRKISFENKKKQSLTKMCSYCMIVSSTCNAFVRFITFCISHHLSLSFFFAQLVFFKSDLAILTQKMGGG
eukprot:SAG11_NODE_9015_length_953_cov_1.906323_2_plen_215_part_00